MLVCDKDEVPWSLSGSLWGDAPTPVGIFPDGKLLIARGERYEYRYVDDSDGTIYLERRIQSTGTDPYREVWITAPWIKRSFWFSRPIGVLNGTTLYGKQCLERSYQRSPSFAVIQRKPLNGPGDVYIEDYCTERG